jgi:hypothetical protein
MAIRSNCVAVQLGDGVVGSPVAISTVAIANGVATVTATGINASAGDTILIAGSTGVAGLNAFHCASTGDTNEFTITDGNILGTLGTVGTATIYNSSWQTISEVATFDFEQSYNISEAPVLDDCTGIVQKVATTVSGTGNMTLSWLPGNATQGMVSGLSKLAKGRGLVWVRAQNNAFSETTPTYEAFSAVLNSYARAFESGTHQQLTLGLDLNTVIMTTE